ncbi:MAG: glycosyltransferase family 39 protein [Patescibacteria group bacterium]
MLRKILEEIKNHKFIYLLLSLVLIGATFVRVFNTKEILGFYYDQGRDALVIWNFLHKGDLFLVGPTTGIEGILRGPWYYFLILPFYFLGGGNPVWPANFLALTTVVAIVLLYILGKEIFDRSTGLIAAIIASFSYYLLVASRWLSNPTPMLLISMLLVMSMFMIVKGKKFAWIFIAILLGLSMQFGSATETFYIPSVAIFALKYRPTKKIFFVSLFSFFLIFLPQIIFDIVKKGVLSRSILEFLFDDGSFKFSFWEVVSARLSFYWEMFSFKIWVGPSQEFTGLFLLFFSMIVFDFKRLWKKDGFKILILLGLAPLIGMIFFQGNEGNIFDYYFTGYYLIYVLIFSAGLGILTKNRFSSIFVIAFFFLFFKSQTTAIKGYLDNGRSNVGFKEQILAIDWIYKNADGENFNVDIYVPPVIPYAYDYLFTWKAILYHKSPLTENVNLLYTLYEEDIPTRLDPWTRRQDKIGKIEEEIVFRGITVQRRKRLWPRE